MVNITFNEEELLLIRHAVGQGHNFWGDPSLGVLKRKIKNYLRAKQFECCCYCSRSIDDEFNMVLDIEHVIPKSKIVSEMFVMDNLAVSCKRCNMRIKGEDISFIDGDFENFKQAGNFYQSEHYKFLHPNIDSWDDHLVYIVDQRNRKKIVYYQVVNSSVKGMFTKKYFQLDKIQVNTFDEAQDAVSRREPLDPSIAEKYSVLLSMMLGR
ncbi:HNH endonuclease [Enterobacter hormaechei]|uniref:HNH endonuclease n=1 Tax=Enterobacter hormaechei TaxID=158836 RepID=UPI003D7D74A2